MVFKLLNLEDIKTLAEKSIKEKAGDQLAPIILSLTDEMIQLKIKIVEQQNILKEYDHVIMSFVKLFLILEYFKGLIPRFILHLKIKRIEKNVSDIIN
jgi:hypothetical protein